MLLLSSILKMGAVRSPITSVKNLPYCTALYPEESELNTKINNEIILIKLRKIREEAFEPYPENLPQ
jgi:hypothetical protein